MDLKKIIKGCLKKDRASQQELYTYTYEHLATAVALYCRDATDRDWVFNLGMLKIYGSLQNYKLGTNYLGWARTLLVRSAIDNIRKNQRYNEHLAPVTPTEVEGYATVLNDAMNQLQTEELIHTIQSLPDREQLVFTMYEIDGFTHKEIEGITSIKINTSKWLLAKAKKTLIEAVASLQIKTNGHGQ